MLNGPAMDNQGINFLPLHGSIIHTPHKFVFGQSSIANIFQNESRTWSYFAREMERFPTLFIGYSFNDASVLQSMFSALSQKSTQKDIWVMIREEDNELEEVYESYGFNIIYSDIKQFLIYLSEFKATVPIAIKSPSYDLFKDYLVPRNVYDLRQQRPIIDFYQGASPQWCDILSNQICPSHFLSVVLDSIYDEKKHTIIIGAPVSGKSTLLMQAAHKINDIGFKFYFDVLTEARATFLMKLLNGANAVFFIDNVADSIDAINVLDKKNIRIVAAERGHNYSIVSHLLPETRFNVINVTSLNDADLQGIFNALPASIRRETLKKERELNLYSSDSIFEFVIRNITSQNIRERYKIAISTIEKEDFELAEFLVLCAYMHSCRIPLSSEMAHRYFEDYDFDDIFCLRSDASDIIKDYIPSANEKYADMDYYYPRSLYIAEVIIGACSKQLLKKVMLNVVSNIPPFVICNYWSFRRHAFDKNLTVRAFDNWKEGKDYYDRAYAYDSRNPYVLQQGALYLAAKHQYEEAFIMIDKAINMTDDKYFSIRNSHAIILFNANIDKSGEGVKRELDRSMNILERCMKDDARKRFHAVTYARQAVKYYSKYCDDVAISYIYQADKWLMQEYSHCKWDNELTLAKDLIKGIISSISPKS